LAHEHLRQAFLDVDQAIHALERTQAPGEPDGNEVIEHTIGLIRRLMDAYIRDAGAKVPAPPEAEFLKAFKVLVKGDPSWNAIRDNCRELVYYRNCIQLGRSDVLPAVAERMAVRIARHVYLYMRTRCERERRLVR
jgi:hypothetical protein